MVTIGSTNGASSLTEKVGTGNYVLDGVTNSTYTIGASTTTGSYTLGGTAQTGTITLGSSSGTNIVAIGAGTGATTVNIAGGATNAKTVNIATGAVANITTNGTTTASSTLTLNAPAAGLKIGGFAEGALVTSSAGAVSTVTGTAGFVLTANAAGTAPSFQTLPASSSALTLISTQTASASSSITFTTGISSSNDAYLLICKKVVLEAAAASANTLEMQISTDGGSTWKTTSYNTPSGITTGFDLGMTTKNAAQTVTWNGQIQLFNFTGSTNIPMITGLTTYSVTSTLATGQGTPGFAYQGGTVAVNALKILMTDASNFSGVFSLYSYSQ